MKGGSLTIVETFGAEDVLAALTLFNKQIGADLGPFLKRYLNSPEYQKQFTAFARSGKYCYVLPTVAKCLLSDVRFHNTFFNSMCCDGSRIDGGSSETFRNLLIPWSPETLLMKEYKDYAMFAVFPWCCLTAQAKDCCVSNSHNLQAVLPIVFDTMLAWVFVNTVPVLLIPQFFRLFDEKNNVLEVDGTRNRIATFQEVYTMFLLYPYLDVVIPDTWSPKILTRSWCGGNKFVCLTLIKKKKMVTVSFSLINLDEVIVETEKGTLHVYFSAVPEGA